MEKPGFNRESRIQAIKADLERSRISSDTYLIGRKLMLLKGLGIEEPLNENEFGDILQKLEQTRSGKSTMPILEPGYELARWLMIIRALKPDYALAITPSDKQLIDEAMESYRKEENYDQIGSLIETCKYIGVQPEMKTFSKEEEQRANASADALAQEEDEARKNLD
jgi:hypothetical protein